MVNTVKVAQLRDRIQNLPADTRAAYPASISMAEAEISKVEALLGFVSGAEGETVAARLLHTADSIIAVLENDSKIKERLGF